MLVGFKAIFLHFALIMLPKKVSGKGDEEKRKVVRKSIEFKKELIAKYESGVRVSQLAKEYGMANIAYGTRYSTKCKKIALNPTNTTNTSSHHES